MSSASFEIKFPKYVAYRESDSTFYKKLIDKDSDTPFCGLLMSDVFIYAMSLGFNAGRRTPFLQGKRTPTLPAAAFDGKKRWLMRALAVADTRRLEDVLDNRKVVHIAEEYANTGIDILQDLHQSQRKDDGGTDYEGHLRNHLKNLHLP